jgi:hypothetical protein
MLRLQDEIYRESSKKKILSWDLDFPKILAKTAHFAKISDRILTDRVQKQILMHVTGATGPFVWVEIDQTAADDEKAADAGITLKVTSRSTAGLQGLVAKMSPFCKNAIKTIDASFEERLNKLGES